MLLLEASVLSDDEKDIVAYLRRRISDAERPMGRLDAYYEGSQRLEHIGIAVPPELRHFETVLNVPGMAVDEPTLRQRLRGFYRAGDSTRADQALTEAWEYNNLDSESIVLHQEEKVFGRSFVSVHTNPEDPENPRITVEDPREIGYAVDPVTRRMQGMLRLWKGPFARASSPTHGTLYLPGSTIHMVRDRRGWVVSDRDDHGLGVVPAVMFAHRRRAMSGRVEVGRSAMRDVIGLTDGIARLLTNMQVGAESHALPSYILTGAAQGDFTDRDGKPIPVWESYLTAIKAVSNENSRVFQITAGDLKNFTDAINNMLAWCASVLGLPTRYAGQQTVNPAAEGAIRADEVRLVTRVGQMSKFDGDAWAWVMGLHERFRTGEWGKPNTIRTLWYDPGTSTIAQTVDAAVKMRQVGAISVEGMWDMLDWDEARKNQERDRLSREGSADPIVKALSVSRMPDAPLNG